MKTSICLITALFASAHIVHSCEQSKQADSLEERIHFTAEAREFERIQYLQRLKDNEWKNQYQTNFYIGCCNQRPTVPRYKELKGIMTRVTPTDLRETFDSFETPAQKRATDSCSDLAPISEIATFISFFPCVYFAYAGTCPATCEAPAIFEAVGPTACLLCAACPCVYYGSKDAESCATNQLSLIPKAKEMTE